MCSTFETRSKAKYCIQIIIRPSEVVRTWPQRQGPLFEMVAARAVIRILNKVDQSQTASVHIKYQVKVDEPAGSATGKSCECWVDACNFNLTIVSSDSARAFARSVNFSSADLQSKQCRELQNLVFIQNITKATVIIVREQ